MRYSRFILDNGIRNLIEDPTIIYYFNINSRKNQSSADEHVQNWVFKHFTEFDRYQDGWIGKNESDTNGGFKKTKVVLRLGKTIYQSAHTMTYER